MIKLRCLFGHKTKRTFQFTPIRQSDDPCVMESELIETVMCERCDHMLVNREIVPFQYIIDDESP